MPRKGCSPSGVRERCCRLGGDRAGEEDATPERATQAFEPADQVDGGADRGEVQPVGGTHIAPQHFTKVEREAELQRRSARAGARLVQMCHAGAGGAHGIECGVAGGQQGSGHQSGK